MNTLLIGLAAFILDWLLGDPPRWPHPVRWMGCLISWLETRLRRHAMQGFARYVAGGLLWIVVVGISGVGCWWLLEQLESIHPMLRVIIEIWLGFTTLAGKCLKQSAYAVLIPLKSGDIAHARQMLSYIVGRDTSKLDHQQITRATVETVAENTIDGVIAPMLFLFLGGVPWAVAYKAVNTLDSMVGYKNERFREMGFVSAKMDDIANFLPARIGWLMLALSAVVLRLDARAALKVGWRDRYNHKSPNSAWSEAAVAGALGVKLGGPSQYFGEWVDKPWIGDKRRDIEIHDIALACRLMLVSSILSVGFCSLWILI
ncbi:adenosylcobinamide-phosphate synthase CbiB [Vibrio olivae]|uniref:Cobalamin biosynthesis protein CobD n=1 Tax=Vibrio olivae TaxID=1243002 RepID=A0ABV5HIR2_9VIBR